VHSGYPQVGDLEDTPIILEMEYVGWLEVSVTAVHGVEVSQAGCEPSQLCDGPNENGQFSVMFAFPELVEISVFSPWEDDAMNSLTSSQMFDEVVIFDVLDLVQISFLLLVSLVALRFGGLRKMFVREMFDRNATWLHSLLLGFDVRERQVTQ
jgi:hypothetical protein